jgi:membrane-associated protease RseP (regulator of RpoE activity)
VYLSQRQTAQGGAQVTQVYPAGPAARAGLRAGDIISSVNGQEVSDGSELIRVIEQQEPGSRAQLTILRNNQQMELPLTLGSRQSFTWSGGEQFSGQQGQYASSQSGQSGEEDYWGNVPPFAMQLEHERRMYEQHQRIETQISKLQEEIAQLRQLIQQQRR